jgi:hypothetical protein
MPFISWRVVEDEPLAGVGGRVELELLAQPFNGRRLAKTPPGRARP